MGELNLQWIWESPSLASYHMNDVASVEVCQGISPTPMGILEEQVFQNWRFLEKKFSRNKYVCSIYT